MYRISEGQCQYLMHRRTKGLSHTLPTCLKSQTVGARFRNEAARKGVSTKAIAGRVDQAESTVRSWLNGNREVNLTDFFRLCDAAGIEPALVLFSEVGKVIAAWNLAEGGERESLVLITEAILKRHEEAAGRRRGAA
jgi:transcriptional regulator with XRE-family HTH domain